MSYIQTRQKNNKMKTLTILSLILFYSPLLSAQNLVIEYDVTTDRITFRDTSGTTIKRPAAKKNQNVLLRLVNFNDYTLEATISAKGINQKVADGNINLVGGKMLGQETTNFMSFFQKNANISDQTNLVKSKVLTSNSHPVEMEFLMVEQEPLKKDILTLSNEQKLIALKQIDQKYKLTSTQL